MGVISNQFVASIRFSFSIKKIVLWQLSLKFKGARYYRSWLAYIVKAWHQLTKNCPRRLMKITEENGIGYRGSAHRALSWIKSTLTCFSLNMLICVAEDCYGFDYILWIQGWEILPIFCNIYKNSQEGQAFFNQAKTSRHRNETCKSSKVKGNFTVILSKNP